MRCTSTPITPEPSWRRAKAAIAMRARSRIAPSAPSRSAWAICARNSSSSDSASSSRLIPSCSRTPWRAAAASAARKKKRSKTSSKTLRSSWLLASVAASASRKSSWEVQLISPSTAKASRSSEVPTATPSRRSSSPNSKRRAGSVSGDIGRRAQLEADALGDDVHVGAVLDDHRHRLREGLGVDLFDAQQQQRPRPVDRLGDRGRLLEVQRAHHSHHLDELARDRLRQLGTVRPP